MDPVDPLAIAGPAPGLPLPRSAGEAALRESEERFRVTFDQSAVGMAQVAPDGRWLHVNQRLCETLGYTHEELLALTFQDLTYSDDLHVDLDLVAQVLAGTLSRYSLEKRYRRKDGSLIWANLTVSLIRDEAGAPQFFISVVEDISRTKAAEAEVRAQRDRAQTYLDLAGVMMVAVAADQTISLINKKGCEMLGGSEAELLGRNWFECFIPERHRPEVMGVWADLLAGRVELRRYHENPILTLAGEERLIAWNNVIFAGPDGQVSGTLSSGEDITERRRAEEELQRAHQGLEARVRQRTAELEAENVRRMAVQDQLRREMRHVALLQKAAVAANEAYTVEAAFQTCLEEVCTLAGWDAGHAVLFDVAPAQGTSTESIWYVAPHHPPERLEGGRSLLSHVIRTGQPVWVEDLQRTYPAEGTVWRGGVAVPIRLQARVAGVLEFFCLGPLSTDSGLLRVMEHVAAQLGRVVERARIEHNLSQQAQLLELAHDTIIVRDLESRIRSWNQGAEKTYGWTPEEALGQVTHTLLSTHHPEGLEMLTGCLFEVGEWEGEVLHTRKDGEILVVESRQVLQRNEEGWPTGILEINRDVTARKRAERALEARAQELARSNADLEQFANVASHDLQEPLRMVASYTQLLAKRYGGQLDPRADRWIGYAVDGANRMQTLINDLLAYSRVGTRGSELLPVSVEAAVEAALANLRIAIREAGAEVTYTPLPVVQGDGTQLIQLFQNLIGNAVKFRGEQAPRVVVTATRDADEWVFSVQDNGIGIPPEFTERIFVIFQRLHERERYAGTGIGLAICKRIVERHGGRIWLETAPGAGCTFFFTLPGALAE
jgi:PAS domain S-box-containing protein